MNATSRCFVLTSAVALLSSLCGYWGSIAYAVCEFGCTEETVFQSKNPNAEPGNQITHFKIDGTDTCLKVFWQATGNNATCAGTSITTPRHTYESSTPECTTWSGTGIVFRKASDPVTEMNAGSISCCGRCDPPSP